MRFNVSPSSNKPYSPPLHLQTPGKASIKSRATQATNSQSKRVQAPPNAPSLIILPGFGNASVDYEAPFGNEDASLAASLSRRGFKPYVVPVERKDWFKVGKMIFTRSYWSSSCTTHPGYSWYLDKVKETVDTALSEQSSSSANNKVVLVGHSAGGWLARAFIGQNDWKDDPLSSSEEEPHSSVAGLITLGTPHSPPPQSSNVKDMTGGALTWVDSRWPGAYFSKFGIKYISVGSTAITGDKDADRRTLSGYSYGSYKQVVGEGHEVEGDAVVPLDAALLEGAEKVVLGGNVLHSMSRVRTFNEPAEDGLLWYGSEDVVDSWLYPMFVAAVDEKVK